MTALPDTSERWTRQPTQERPHPAGMGGVQRLYRFPNGRGASVVQSPYSYGGDAGLWELAVLVWPPELSDTSGGGMIDYDSGITDDVLGWLGVPEVEELLNRTEALPAYSAVRS